MPGFLEISSAAPSTTSGELDEETRRKLFNSGKGNKIKNPWLPPKSRGVGLYGHGARQWKDRTDRPFGNEFAGDDMSFDKWQVREEARERKKRVQPASDSPTKSSRTGSNEEKRNI